MPTMYGSGQFGFMQHYFGLIPCCWPLADRNMLKRLAIYH